jgi:AraC-like DNA-binding protein
MDLHHRTPGAPLNRFVQSFWVARSQAPAHRKERLLPDGAMALVINLHEDQTRIYDRQNADLCQRFNGCLLMGVHSEHFVIDTAEQVSVAGIHFRPGGAFPFLGMPADELEGLHVPLDALWGRFAGDLRERLLESGSPAEQLMVMEQALRTRLRRPLSRHPAVEFALREFQYGPQARSVSEVTEETGLSARRFIEVFREQVGVAPKRFCRVQRFQKVLRSSALAHDLDWSSIALECSYFDQAHFIHDFRAFSGLTPTAYAQQRHGLYTNHVPMRE